VRKLLPAILFVLACARHEAVPAGPEITVAASGRAAARVIILCEALATKEGGPKETLTQFGEVYAFAPSAFSVRREQPTEIVFWNLQADDEHDFMLLDSKGGVVTQFKLPPLARTSRLFTFHREGLFRFDCTMHQPEMTGQITVLPAPAWL
jgi:plastocyanin